MLTILGTCSPYYGTLYYIYISQSSNMELDSTSMKTDTPFMESQSQSLKPGSASMDLPFIFRITTSHGTRVYKHAT